MAYANGANPQVPPYLALGELNRRKQILEKSQAEQMQAQAQSSQGTVKDQVEQQAGVMALQQGRQQQAMQNAVRMGSMAPAGIPAGIPQPQPQTVQAAGGGLLSLLSDRERRYNSGGIIAFREGTKDQTVGSAADILNEATDAAETQAASLEEDEDEVRSAYRRLNEEAEAFKKNKPTYVSPLAEREALMKQYPEKFAALREPEGQAAMQRLEGIQALRRAEIEKQREEAARMRPGILQQLGQAAMASRGQQGRGALASILGGYSDISSKTEADAVKQEQGLRMREIELQQARTEAMNKLDDIKRAREEGDLQGEIKAKQEFQKILKDYNVSATNLLRGQISAAGSVLGRQVSGEARVEAAEIAATRAAARGQGGPYVRSTKTDQSGNVIAIMSDGSTRPLGIKAGDYNARLAKIIGDMEKLEPKFGKLPEEEKRRRATIRLSGESPAAAAPAAPASSAAAPAGAKIMTQADVAMTAKKSGKTEEEVRQAAKAAGYTIQ